MKLQTVQEFKIAEGIKVGQVYKNYLERVKIVKTSPFKDEVEVDKWAPNQPTVRIKLKKAIIKNYQLITEQSNDGLMVIGKTPADDKKIGKFAIKGKYHAEFIKDGRFWIFPEKQENYDALELELEKQFTRLGIDVRFEGMWN